MKLEELLRKQADGEVVVIDVRNEDEYRVSNPLVSVNIPLSSLGHNPEQINRFDKQVVLVCLSGRRSEMAQETISMNLNLDIEILEEGLQELI